jgi:hypothetical protein
VSLDKGAKNRSKKLIVSEMSIDSVHQKLLAASQEGLD